MAKRRSVQSDRGLQHEAAGAGRKGGAPDPLTQVTLLAWVYGDGTINDVTHPLDTSLDVIYRSSNLDRRWAVVMVEGVYLVLDMFDVGVTSNPPPYTVYHEQPRSFADKDHAIVSTVMRATIALGENLGKNDQLKRPDLPAAARTNPANRGKAAPNGASSSVWRVSH
jgi:hypothetical protein